MSVSLRVAPRSVAGPRHAANEDSVACADSFAFVADGVGGHAGGDVASWTVTHRLLAALATRDVRRLDAAEVRELVAVANAELGGRARHEPWLAGMATTFTGVFCAAGSLALAHVGDSRAYLVREGSGRRMTRDDSLVQMLVDSGAVTAEAAATHPNRNVILRSLAGRPDDGDGIAVTPVTGRAGDRWLVTSDGLTDAVPEEEVLATLAAAATVDDAADALVAAAHAAGAGDDVSLVVCDVVAPDPGAGGDTHDGGRPRGVQCLGAAAAPEHGTLGRLG